MDIETAKTLTSIEGDIKEICKDQGEMKGDIKELKNIYTSLEKFKGLEVEVSGVKEDIKDIKGNLSKVVWAIILTVLGAVLSLVIKGV